MENNAPPSNRPTKCCKWIARHGTNLVLAVMAVVMGYVAILQHGSMRMQTIAVQNNPVNHPKLKCWPFIGLDGSINVTISNEGATIEKLKSSQTSWVRVHYDRGRKDLPTSFIYSKKRRPDEEETLGEIRLTFRTLNFNKILEKCDTSKKIRVTPFVVIYISQLSQLVTVIKS